MRGHDRWDRPADPLLETGFAALRDDVPADVEWDRLRRSIRDQARPVLAQRRKQRFVSPLRPLVTLAAAASIAGALVVAPGLFERFSGSAPIVAEAPAPLDAEQLLVEALGSDLTDDEFRLVVSGRAYPEALLAFAISEP